jgi:hypothetical protein
MIGLEILTLLLATNHGRCGRYLHFVFGSASGSDIILGHVFVQHYFRLGHTKSLATFFYNFSNDL